MGCTNSSPRISNETDASSNIQQQQQQQASNAQAASPGKLGSVKKSEIVTTETYLNSNIIMNPKSSVKSPPSSNRPVPSSVKSSYRSPPFMKIINEKCPLVRLDHCAEPRKLSLSGQSLSYNMDYVYVSQRGYYPTALNKPNQDSYLICEKILDDQNCNFFGVFDGHGETGDLCSFFAADRLADCLVNELQALGGTKAIDSDKLTDLYTRAFLTTNFELHGSNDVDDSLSGTTGVTLLQKGDKLFVANVGDSRAIIATEVNGELKYRPLSSDQTPYRKDERERLKKAGARIMTMDQIDGYEPIHENYGTDLGEEIDQGGDPPRVWDQTLEKPGCAFSRSIGDAVGKSVGVTAEPEILAWNLTPDDRFAVIASDGVFEFITSQGVVDMIAKYDSILEAAKRVVAEAYRLWLTFDDRTDDITIIILQFKDMKKQATAVTVLNNSFLHPNSNGSNSSSVYTTSAAAALLNAANGNNKQTKKAPELARAMSLSRALSSDNLLDRESRPVRKVMSKAKRRDIAENWSKEDTIVIDFNSLENNKSQEEIARISTMFNNSFMFQNLSPIQKDHIYKVLHPRDVSVGELIINEGDQGDEMYIVDSGMYEVLKLDANNEKQVVAEYRSAGDAFGELSLMYGKPRAASVQAKCDGKLWCISRAAFRAVMLHGQSEGLMEIYRSIPVLNELRLTALHRLCLGSKELTFNKGDVLVNTSNLSTLSWSICVVITGVIRLNPILDTAVSSDSSVSPRKRELRAELAYFSIFEIGTKFSEAIADSHKVKITCVSKALYDEILLENGQQLQLKEAVLKKKSKGKRLPATKSPLTQEENLQLEQDFKSKEEMEFDHAIAFIGDFGYFTTFKEKTDQEKTKPSRLFSVKIFGKSKAVASRMERRLLNERNLLAAFTKIFGINCAGLPVVNSTFQDDKWAFLVFRDQFVCDLGQAIHNQAIPEDSGARLSYAVSLFSAVSKVHELGLIHRCINPSSMYITRGGNLKLVDFRFTKVMDGSYRMTICGDPLYFAPEIVSQQGYDYGVDIWAMGVVLFELFEGCTPFGNVDTDETSIFRAITSYRPSKLNFTRTPDEARRLIIALLQYGVEERLGYKDPMSVTTMDFFSSVNWEKPDQLQSYPIDILTTLELGSPLDDDRSIMPLASNAVFEQF